MRLSTPQREAARCAFLHHLCGQIEQWRVAGATVKQATTRARKMRRRLLFKYGRLSRSRLTNLYYIWRRQPTAATFLRNYKPGNFRTRVPLALIEEFLNRLAADKVVPAKAVMRSLRSDWRSGKPIPGLGTWQEYCRRRHGDASPRTVAPPFPVSATSFYGFLSTSTPAAYHQRIVSALRAQRELNRFLAFIEARRNEVTVRRRHELLGQSGR